MSILEPGCQHTGDTFTGLVSTAQRHAVFGAAQAEEADIVLGAAVAHQIPHDFAHYGYELYTQEDSSRWSDEKTKLLPVSVEDSHLKAVPAARGHKHHILAVWVEVDDAGNIGRGVKTYKSTETTADHKDRRLTSGHP